jgi:PAS domain S-box-containing protein
MREREYLDTLCNTGDGVFIVDADKHIVRWNKGAEKILGYSEVEVLNRNCFQIISGKTAPNEAHCSPNCLMHTVVLKGDPQENFDLLTQASNGTLLWLNMTVISPVGLAEPFVAHIIRDVTHEKRTALALLQFLANLESSGRIPHDISTEKPISSYPIDRHSTPDKTATALSGREIEVLTLLAEGLSTKSLAQKLNISHFTARNHIQNILVKLDLHSKAQAVSYAFKKGIL